MAAEDRDADSCLNYFRRLVQLRKQQPVLIYGNYTLIDADNQDVYAYTRELDGQRVLVLLNFHAQAASIATGLDLRGAKRLIGNYAAPGATIAQGNATPVGVMPLRPYQAVLLELH